MKLQSTLIFAYQLKPCCGIPEPRTANTYPMADKPFTPAAPGAEIVCAFQSKDPQDLEFVRAHRPRTMPPIVWYSLLQPKISSEHSKKQKFPPFLKAGEKDVLHAVSWQQKQCSGVLIASISLLANLWQSFLPLFSQLLCRKQTVIIWSWRYSAISRLTSAIYFRISQRYTPVSCHLCLDCRWKQFFPKKNILSKKFFTYSCRW